jgi:uncharacterized protein
VRRIFFLAACLSGLAFGAQAASFDCAKAATAVENAICADPALSLADEQMAQAYSKAMAATLAPRALRADQIRWLAERDAGHSLDGLGESYARRIAELSKEASQWQSLRREVGEPAARQTCVVPPGSTDSPCTVDAFADVVGSGNEFAFQLQSYHDGQLRTGGGAVVFHRRGALLAPVIATADDGVRFYPPIVVSSPAGRLLEVRGTMEGTGVINAGSLYLMDGEKLAEIDTDSWLSNLAKHLPKGWGAWKGIYPNYAKLTASTPLWKNGDGNCCPSAGRATLKLGINNGRLMIVDLNVRSGEDAARGN